jgi:Glycosyl hydrolase family 3 N terminal domain
VSPWLLTTVLRDDWGYDGLVMSDWGAVHDPVAEDSALISPLISVTQFPGFPITSEDAEQLLVNL